MYSLYNFNIKNQVLLGNVQARSQMHMQEEKARVTKTVLNKKYKVTALALPDTDLKHKDSPIDKLNKIERT